MVSTALFQGTWPGQVTHTPIDHNSAPQNGADSHLELLPLQSPLLRAGYGNVGAGSVVRHDGFGHFTGCGGVGGGAGCVGTDAGVVGNQDARSTHVLGVADLLHKGAVSAIHHEQKGRRVRFHTSTFLFSCGKASTHVVDFAKVRVCVVDILDNRSPVGRNSKERLPVPVSSFLVKPVRDVDHEFTGIRIRVRIRRNFRRETPSHSPYQPHEQHTRVFHHFRIPS
jgi:hypothetical protein